MTSEREPAVDGAGDGWFVRAAGFVGDLGNPFYAEERQRDVWNEASAVGFQLMLWLALVSSAAAVWVVGAPAVPAVLAGVSLLGVVCLVTIAYATRLGVAITGAERMLRVRLVPYLAVVALLAVGLVRAAPAGDSTSGGFGVGLAVGAAGAVLAVVVSEARARRRRRG